MVFIFTYNQPLLFIFTQRSWSRALVGSQCSSCFVGSSFYQPSRTASSIYWTSKIKLSTFWRVGLLDTAATDLMKASSTFNSATAHAWYLQHSLRPLNVLQSRLWGPPKRYMKHHGAAKQTPAALCSLTRRKGNTSRLGRDSSGRFWGVRLDQGHDRW